MWGLCEHSRAHTLVSRVSLAQRPHLAPACLRSPAKGWGASLIEGAIVLMCLHEGKDTQTSKIDHVHVYRGWGGDTKPGQDAEAGSKCCRCN